MAKPCHVVFTTIFIPTVLEELRANAERHGHLDEVKVWVVGDRKTPADSIRLSAEATRRGLETAYLGIEEQDAWGGRFPEFYGRIPYNNETRRNLGYLRALEEGCRTLICIDDDNFPTEDDFIGNHLRTGSPITAPLLHEEAGFHNVCEYLKIQPARPLFPRGFPFRLRGHNNSPRPAPVPPGGRIGVTAGLWLKEPDIDATSWLNGKVESVGYTGPDYFTLSQDTWSPINTQNTSVARELIPGFLCIPMGHDVPGGKIQRYGDIWGGYILQAVLRGTPYHVSFGRPLVEHRRNPHDYLDDLRFEFWGMILTDWFTELLRNEFSPTAATIPDRVLELAVFIEATMIKKMPPWCPAEARAFLTDTGRTLAAWAEVCRRLA